MHCAYVFASMCGCVRLCFNLEGPPDVEPNTGLSDSTLIAIIVTTLVVVLAIFALVVIFVMRGKI